MHRRLRAPPGKCLPPAPHLHLTACRGDQGLLTTSVRRSWKKKHAQEPSDAGHGAGGEHGAGGVGALGVHAIFFPFSWNPKNRPPTNCVILKLLKFR